MTFRRFRFGDPGLPEAFRAPAVALGVFDGVHRGHLRVLADLTRSAAAAGVDPVAVTYHPHPREVLTGQGPELLTSLDHRVVLLARQGLAGVVVFPFSREVAAWSADEFVERLLVRGLRASQVLVGAGHRFGRGRQGDIELLRRLGARHGFEAREVALERLAPAPDPDPSAPLASAAATAPPEREQIVSSTAIRQALREGRLDEAAALLGRPVSVLGEVVAGDRRGRLLGFPTANLDLHHAARPPRGVYAARARVLGPAGEEGPLLPAVVNIGRRPTFHPEVDRDLVEVHLLAGGRDLYGERLEVLFAARLRDERRFSGPDELRAQIERDAARARELLTSPADPPPLP